MTKHFLEMTTEEREYQLDCANTFLKWTREDIKDVTKSFFRIGFRLYEARAYKYYEALGYPDIETLAEEEFGFKRSSTYGFMQVYEKVCIKHGHNTMDERYIGYDYSKLLELCKVKLAVHDILNRIKPTDSVRDIHQYVKFWNAYTSKHSTTPKITLQEWKTQQEKPLVILPPVSDSNPVNEEPTDTVPNETQPNTDVNNVAPTVEQPTETVQTFGLPSCAKIEEKTPKYNFSTRAGVREFLKDCLQWKEKECYSPFIGCHYYMLKNKRHIYVYIQRTASKNSIDGIYEVIHRFFIDLNQYSDVPVEITKEQFEQYCAEHKDEL